MRVESDGTTSTTTVDTKDATRAYTEPWLFANPGLVVPDPRGGAHMEWSISTEWPYTPTRHGYAGPDGVVTVAEGRVPFMRVGDALTGYDWPGNAYDMTTGALKYSAPAGGGLIAPAAEAGGGDPAGAGVAEADVAAVGIVRDSSVSAPEGAATVNVEFIAPLAGGGAAYRVADEIVEVDGTGAVMATTSAAGMPWGTTYAAGSWMNDRFGAGYAETVLGEALLGFPDWNGNLQPKSGREPGSFATREEAVRWVTWRYQTPGFDLDREFGGSICRDESAGTARRYFSSIPNKGVQSVGGSDEPGMVTPSQCPLEPGRPNVRVGSWHLHGPNGNQGFSGPDNARIPSPNTESIRFYVGVPCGFILLSDVRDVQDYLGMKPDGSLTVWDHVSADINLWLIPRRRGLTPESCSR